MTRSTYLGEFEQLVLLALARLDVEAYGVAIRGEIERRTGQEVATGSVYAVLDRMEKKGYVASRLGEPTRERGGRAKRYFRLLQPGAAALTRARGALDQLWDGLEIEPETYQP